MSNARERIFRRLQQAETGIQIDYDSTFTANIEMTKAERIAHFCERMTSVRAEVHVTAKDKWLTKLKGIVKEKQLNNLLYAAEGPLGEALTATWTDEDLPPLISKSADIDHWKDELFFGIDAAITSSRAGIAETGTLVIWPTEQEPRTYSLVPPIHIAVLDSDRLYTSFEETIKKEQWQGGMPSNVLLISGPSKSADIEQTLAYGVHGPTELIVLLIAE